MSDLSSIIRWLSFVTIIMPQRKFYSDRKCHLRNILGLIDGTSLFKLKELSLHAQLRYYTLHILSYWLNSIMEILMFRVQLKHIMYVVWGVHNGDVWIRYIMWSVRPGALCVCVASTAERIEHERLPSCINNNNKIFMCRWIKCFQLHWTVGTGLRGQWQREYKVVHIF